MSFDAIIRTETTEIALADGVIAARRAGRARSETTRARSIDARGLDVLPGLIDAHVHFNDPGRAAWEGWGSGTRALAAGGFTCGVDMPLNSDPPTVDAGALEAKLAAARGVGARRLRALGRARARQRRAHGRARGRRRRRLQGVHGRQRHRRLRGLRRPRAVRGHVPRRAARAARRGARRERGDRARARPARAGGGPHGDGRLRRLAAGRGRGRGHRDRARDRRRGGLRPAHRRTSRAAARPCSWPRRARPGPT